MDMKAEKHTQSHTHAHVRSLHHARELLETNLPVAILIRLHDGLIYDLLQLHILQVVPNHHLEHQEQFAV